MRELILKILDQLILKKAFLKDYPKPGVSFLAIDPLLNDPAIRKTVVEAVTRAIDPQSFDAVASVASRGYLFSGIIASQLTDKGEYLVQKVKVPGDSRYVQLNTTTEYSSDALQLFKNTIKPGKKYLLTDDLVATGGSLKTAIRLIRECGGVIDTVFVMTELTDFNARDALKKDGVELISLLRLSQQDLEKLIKLQDCYAENICTPITYSLTHHKKGQKELIAANKTPELTIHLASESLLKVEATQLASHSILDPLEIHLIPHDAQSSVNNQPFGYDETLRGAQNRIKNIEPSLKDSENAVIVSIENGIRFSKEDDCYYDFVQVVLKKDEMMVSHAQDCCKIPQNVITAIQKNKQEAFVETWGETALRMGLVDDLKNPHQSQKFGGISRTEHLIKAVSKTLGLFKEKIMEQHPIEQEDQQFTVNRVVELKSKHHYEKKGIFFTPSKEATSKPINFYNQGCPIDQWQIDSDKVKRNQFQIFSTGDAFSVVSPDIDISGSNINIHAGIQHPNYSPLVLIQEALQLCRAAYEHGARSITVALPEQFHPVLHFSDFNSLLLKLFAASGANNVYFYDKQYTGKLDDTNISETLELTFSNHSDVENYTIDRRELDAFLQPPQDLPIIKNCLSLDHQLRYFSRRIDFKDELARFCPHQSGMIKSLCGQQFASELKVPEIKVQPHILLCGSVNKPLAIKIAENLRRRGELVRLYFIEGEGEHAKISDDAAICGATVTIIQSTRPNPDNTKEAREYQNSGASPYLFTATNIAKQAHLRGAETINLINPYQFNARSDKAEDNTKGKTGGYVQQNAKLLEAAGVNNVITAECHDSHTLTGSYTGKHIRGAAVPAISILLTKLAHEWLSDSVNPMQGQLRLVTPDAGAAKRTKELTDKLQAILGKYFCQTRVLGEKKRDSHEDNSALISSLNSGSIGINPADTFVITDDETATGSTLCQAIENLTHNGAQHITVVIAHNNMPLDWLVRQLCLARFLYLGATDLHFSDTHEMGSFAKNYEDLVTSYSKRSNLSKSQIEEKVWAWFKENLSKNFTDKSEKGLMHEFARFKVKFSQFESKIRVHSLSHEFADKVATKPYMVSPHAFEYKVNELVEEIKKTKVSCIVAFAGASLPAVSAAALELGIPLQVIPQMIPGAEHKKMTLPNNTFALIGTPTELTLKTLKNDTGYSMGNLLHVSKEGIDGELVIVSNSSLSLAVKEDGLEAHSPDLREAIVSIEELYSKIKSDPKLKNRPVKLLGIDNEGQVLAGQLGHILNKKGPTIGIVAVNKIPDLNSAVYTGALDKELLSVDKNSLGMGDVTIALGRDFTVPSINAVSDLASNAKIYCPYFLSVSTQGSCKIATQDDTKGTAPQRVYTDEPRLTLFSSPKEHQETQHHNLLEPMNP